MRKMQRLRPPLPAVALNFSLWLARTPPEGLQVNRAAFIWWTGVHYKMRRWALSRSTVFSYSITAPSEPRVCRQQTFEILAWLDSADAVLAGYMLCV